VKVARALIHKEFSISRCAFLVRAVLPFANWKRYFTIFKRGNSLLMILRLSDEVWWFVAFQTCTGK
jgi:hypothetical protein